MKALQNWDSWTGIKELSCLCKAGWNGWTFQLSIVNVFESYDQSRKWGFDKRRKSKSTTYRFREWRHSTDVLLSRSKTLRVGLHGNLAHRPEFYNYDSDLLQHGGACRSAVKTCVRPKLKAWIWRCQHHFASFAGDFAPCSFTTCFPPKEGCRTWRLPNMTVERYFVHAAFASFKHQTGPPPFSLHIETLWKIRQNLHVAPHVRTCEEQ